MESLQQIVACYPAVSSLSADVLLRMLRNKNIPLRLQVQDFLKQPQTVQRADYGSLPVTRQQDFLRMLRDTRIIKNNKVHALSPLQAWRISLAFSALKQWENGTFTIADKALKSLSRDALRKALALAVRDSEAQPENWLLSVKVWAILFEALGIITDKYPHMTQQFAVLTDELCIESGTRILQMATGQGKSHIVALRAARHAAAGKSVDACFSKQTLLQLDMKEYQRFYEYLGFTAVCIDAKSSREAYVNSQIHYTTLGDISLLMDEQCIRGTPIPIDLKKRVALFDELDFIRFIQGLRTEFNYALPTARTAKQMTWFYQAVNEFYQEHLLSAHEISLVNLNDFIELLTKKAGKNSDRQAFLESLLPDKASLLGWLQSAYDAFRQERKITYAVWEKDIQADNTTYRMQEIIPVSTAGDNQKAEGSTYNKGVQQLLAVKLNTQASKDHQPQTYYVHPESNVISTQTAQWRMQELWGSWEGQTATVSQAQISILYQEQQTQVLQVATNLPDRRVWHKPVFCEDEAQRLTLMMEQIRQCLANQQSVLFCCRNDREVLKLKDLLGVNFKLDNFIFYTNENKKTASEVLDRKKKKEQWQNGRKKQAVFLGAAGFGRGDNVDVGAVFLFDVSDSNDLWQKGGRTARHGQEGEVFQFYLGEELRQEEARLLAQASPEEINNLNHLQSSVDEQCFARVLLLREHQFYKQNAVSQWYRNALAQFSSWCMALISQCGDDVDARKSLESQIIYSRNLFEDARMATCDNPEDSSQEKLTFLRQIMLDQASSMIENCPEIRSFSLVECSQNIPVLQSLSEQTIDEGLLKDLAIIGSIIAALTFTSDDCTEVENALNALAENPEKLHFFAETIAGCTSLTTFVTALAINLENDMQIKQTISPYKEGALRVLENSVTTELQQLLQPKKAGFSEPTAKTAVLVLEYLKTFTVEQQKSLGAEYLQNLDRLTLLSRDELKRRLRGYAMNFNDFDSSWKLVQKYKSARYSESVLYETLQAVMGIPSGRTVLTLWENWVGDSSETYIAAFLMHFCQVMLNCNADNFQVLRKKMAENPLQPRYLLLWKKLAAAKMLPGLQELLSVCLADNETWLPYLESLLQLSVAVQSQRQDLFITVIHQLKNKDVAFRLSAFETVCSYFSNASRFPYTDDFILKQLSIAPNADTFKYMLDYALPVTVEKAREENSEKIIAAFKDLYAHARQKSVSACYVQLNIAVKRTVNIETIIDANQQYLVALTRHAAGDQEFFEKYAVWYLKYVNSFSNRFVGLEACVLQHFIQSATKSENFEKIYSLLTRLKSFFHDVPVTHHQALLNLPVETLERVLNLIDDYKHTLKNNPKLWDTLSIWLQDDEITEERFDRISRILLQGIGGKFCQESDKFVSRSEEIRKGSDNELQRFQQLMHLNFSHFVYFDNMAAYLEKHVNVDKQSQALAIRDFFYKKASIKVDGIADAAEAKFFDFSAKPASSKRILWMHMLHKQAFLTGKFRNSSYQWSVERNEALFNHGLQQYVRHAEKILASVKPRQNASFSVDQQREFLKLSEELSMIAQGAPDKTEDVSVLKQDFKVLRKEYKSGFFIAPQRLTQLRNLKQNMKHCTDYASLLSGIDTARRAIMSSDLIANKEKIWKMNSSGHSRIFQTLNRMQERVVSRWVQDTNAVQSFQKYKQHSLREFHGIVNQLYLALKEDNNDNGFYHGCLTLFVSDQSLVAVKGLEQLLSFFDTDVGDGPAIAGLLQNIENVSADLPGHLQTLANEVLIRGQALSEHADVKNINHLL